MSNVDDKPKIRETGSQLIGGGAVVTVAVAVYNFIEAADVPELIQLFQGGHSWFGVAAIAIGSAYRGWLKFLAARNVTVDNDQIDRLGNAFENLYQDVHALQRQATPRSPVVEEGSYPPNLLHDDDDGGQV